MSENPALEAAPSVVQEPSTPAVDVNNEAEKGEIENAPDSGAPKEAEAPKPELTEVEKVKAAMQKRIDRQTAAIKAEQERVRHLEQQYEELKAKAPKVEDEPKPEDFATYEEYEQARIEKLAEKRVNERLKAEKEAELKAAQARQRQETQRRFTEKENAFRNVTPDYDTVAGEAAVAMQELALAGNDITRLRDAVLEFENPPEMIYHLGKDPAMIENLVSMSPLKLMRELVNLENALKGAATPEPKHAPAPIKPVGTASKGSKDLSRMSAKEITEWVKSKHK